MGKVAEMLAAVCLEHGDCGDSGECRAWRGLCVGRGQ